MKTSLLSLSLVSSMATAAAQDMTMPLVQLKSTDMNPKPWCLDGSPGSFFIHKGSDSNKWQLYFEGGGWCYNEKDCFNRAHGDLGSSTNYPPSVERDQVGGGVISASCETNPTFCNHNFVYMKYCDGDSFSGASDIVTTVEGEDQHHRGHYILGGVLESLLADHNLADATELHLTGCSAGGLSTYLHTDYVGEFVRANAPNLEKFGSSPISGFFLDRENVNKEHIYGDQIRTIFNLANATSGVQQACVADAVEGEEWRCNMAADAYKYITNPIFPFDASIDSWQSGCVMTASEVDQSVPAAEVPNGNCHTEEGWENCGGDITKCSVNEMYSVTEYQGSFMRHMSNSDTFSKNGNGAFIYECFTHCAAQDDSFYTNVVLSDGTSQLTMQAATDKWWNGVQLNPATSTNPASNFYPALWNLDASNPNESCSTAMKSSKGCIDGIDCYLPFELENKGIKIM